METREFRNVTEVGSARLFLPSLVCKLPFLGTQRAFLGVSNAEYKTLKKEVETEKYGKRQRESVTKKENLLGENEKWKRCV